MGAGAHVKEREQHLGAGHAALAQQLVIDAIELALADRAGGLQLADRAGTLGQVHHAHAARDRAAGDHYHLRALAMHAREHVAQAREHVRARLAAPVGDDARAELDDQAFHGVRSVDPGGACAAERSPAIPGHPCPAAGRPRAS